MGQYATITSIEVKLPGFIDGTLDLDSMGSATFSTSIDRAEAEINSRLAAVYALPFSPVPPLIREMAFEMGAYYAILAFSSRDWPNKNEMIEEYKRSFTILDEIVGTYGNMTGQILAPVRALVNTDGSVVPRLGTRIISSSQGYTPIFGLDDPKSWRVDPDLEDVLDAGRQ
jgi:phage gp36-like protein